MNGMISPFQMKRHKIVSFSIEQKEVIKDYESANVSLGVDYDISYSRENEDSHMARIDLFIFLSGITEKEELLFEIKLDMMGIFEADKKLVETDKFESMLKINGISTLMQLSRAYVTSATALSGFSHPINFPMVNIYELVKNKEK